MTQTPSLLAKTTDFPNLPKAKKVKHPALQLSESQLMVLRNIMKDYIRGNFEMIKYYKQQKARFWKLSDKGHAELPAIKEAYTEYKFAANQVRKHRKDYKRLVEIQTKLGKML